MAFDGTVTLDGAEATSQANTVQSVDVSCILLVIVGRTTTVDLK